MKGIRGRLNCLSLAVLCLGAALAGSTPAQGAAPEPDSIFFSPASFHPVSVPLEGPCGLAVLPSGGFAGYVYVANYYDNNIPRFNPLSEWMTPPSPEPKGGPELRPVLSEVDPLDGPCGLSFDSTGRLYVNNYHRNVERYNPSGMSFGPPTVIDSSHPTGVAVDPASDIVYVNSRTFVAAYASSGAPVMDGSDPLRIGLGSLGDGYGLAVSQFPATAGRIYVPDYADDTVKVYDPALDKEDPVQVIAGPPGGFGSLRDSAVAVDRVTGEIYVADTLAYPQYTELPEAVIRVFEPTGAYKGRLKYGVIDGSPPGLAVDNSNAVYPKYHPKAGLPTQGRVFVTSGNTFEASVFAYPPGSATSEKGPGAFSLTVEVGGDGGGKITNARGAVDCAASCEADLPVFSTASLVAEPDRGSTFLGWSGGGCSGTGACTVTMDQARSVRAEFGALPQSQSGNGGGVKSVSAPTAAASRSKRSASTSVIAQKGNLRVSVSGRMAPRRLPRRGTAPISVSVGGEITTTDSSLPPQLKAMRIELNRGGHLDSTGLPPCVYDRIQPGSTQRALSACRGSLVGQGSFTANITLAGQEPYPTSGKLLLFHGRKGGRPVLYGHIYSPKPFATSFVIVFALRKIAKGPYGTALDAPLPAAMDAWGRLTGLQMTLSRRYSHAGEPRSFISAGCPAPKGFPGATFPLARTQFSFAGGKSLTSTLNSECKARG